MDYRWDYPNRTCRRDLPDQPALAVELKPRTAWDLVSVSRMAEAGAVWAGRHLLPVLRTLRPRPSEATPPDTATASVCLLSLNTSIHTNEPRTSANKVANDMTITLGLCWKIMHLIFTNSDSFQKLISLNPNFNFIFFGKKLSVQFHFFYLNCFKFNYVSGGAYVLSAIGALQIVDMIINEWVSRT